MARTVGTGGRRGAGPRSPEAQTPYGRGAAGVGCSPVPTAGGAGWGVQTRGAITTAWLALQALDRDTFDTRLCPFLLSIAWLLVSLITSAQAGAAGTRRAAFWVSSLFLGLMNSLTLFSAVVGASTVIM
jgi:hypothetical protein